MLDTLRNLFRPRAALPLPSVPHGQRVYAVGDIHGRKDLFDSLIDAIEADDARRSASATTIILLGDLIDRGDESAGVIAAARELGHRRRVRIIAGNHEEMFLRTFDDLPLLRHFLRYGGRETIMSYGVDPQAWSYASLEEAQEMMRAAVPASDVAFLRNFEDWITIGDYLFVHAGVEPGVPLEQQKLHDLRWIREPFLGHSGDHGFVVVHGHTIEDEPVFRPNRIGIDTGAYSSGRLTALGLEATERWLIMAEDTMGAITVESRPV